jgi:hypothetical protein
MTAKTVKLILLVMIAGALIMFFGPLIHSQDQPFGGKEDVSFANKLWAAMDGYANWKLKSGFYPGRSPHGKFLRIYYNIVPVDGRNYHVIVKDNYGGADATLEKVSTSPADYLVAVTVMVQREKGYDPEDDNWFWVKYSKDGTIEKNDKGLALAGRVAKGSQQGCIACHASAKGNDFFFSND